MAGLRPLVRTAAASSRGVARIYFDAVAFGARYGAVVQHQRKTLVEVPVPRGSSAGGKQHNCQWRGISSTATALHGDHEEGFESAQTVQLTWETPKGERVETEAKCGMNLMRVAHARGIDLEGACEGVCACSTCHVILSGEVFDVLPEPSEDEEDMLDLAFGLKETSRLGCQVIVTPDMDGIVVKLPAATRNFYVDGHVPQPH